MISVARVEDIIAICSNSNNNGHCFLARQQAFSLCFALLFALALVSRSTLDTDQKLRECARIGWPIYCVSIAFACMHCGVRTDIRTQTDRKSSRLLPGTDRLNDNVPPVRRTTPDPDR